MKITLILLLTFPTILFSQYENYNWVFGGNCRVQFDINTKEPVVYNDVFTNVNENTAVISDGDGNLKFYSTDQRLYDEENNYLNRDYRIPGHNSSTQGSIIIELKKDRYLRIATSRVVEEKAFKPLICNTYDNEGYLLSTDTILTEYSAENILVVRNYATENYWLLLHDRYFSHYKIYEINENGVDLSSLKIKDEIEINSDVSSSGIGYLKSSPDGSMIVSCVFRNDFEDSGFYILRNFDPINGEIGGLIDTIRVKSAYSAEFSSNSNFLYYQSYTDDDISGSGLFQYDIYTGEKVRLISGMNDIKTLLLAPDNSIYFTTVNSATLGRIKYPNVKGKDCQIVMNELSLKNGKSLLGLPNICTSDYTDLFIPNIINICDGSDLFIKPVIIGDINNYSYSWVGPNNFSSDELQVFIENPTSENSGIYILTAVNKITGEIKTLDVKVSINEVKPIEIFSSNGYTICEDYTIITLERNFERYEWENGNSNKSRIIDSSGIYWIKAYDEYGCEHYAEFTLDFIRPEIIGPDVICSGQPIELTLDRDYSEYLWNNGSNNKTIKIYQPGLYTVTVKDSSGCEKTVSKLIRSGNYPKANIIGETTICNKDSILIQSDKPHFNFLWSTGDTTQGIKINKPGTYYLTVTNQEGCSTVDSILITEINTEHILDRYSLYYDKHYISEPLKDSILLKNISGQRLIINYDTIIENGDSAYFDFEIEFQKLGVYNDTLNLLITSPCTSVIQVPLVANIYARINLDINDIYSKVGMDNQSINVSISSPIDLDGEYKISGFVDIPAESYFTYETQYFDYEGPIGKNSIMIKEIPGTILLSPELEDDVMFSSIEFESPFVELKLDTGKIFKERVCVNEVRTIRYLPKIEFIIYPNPAKEQIYVETSLGDTDFTFEILNINSETISKGIGKIRNNKTNIGLSKIPPGAYKIIFNINGIFISKNLIIIN